MRVIEQLIDHFRYSERWTDNLQSRLVAAGLLEEFDDNWDGDELCECEYNCCCSLCEWKWYHDEDEAGFELRIRCEAEDAAHRQRSCKGRRQKHQRRHHQASLKEVRLAITQQFDKWSLPGGRLAHLREVGELLTSCGTWQKAARSLLSHPVPHLVQELNRHERYSVRPLLNRLDDFDLVLQSFARPLRGQAGAALRRLVEQRPDKRSRKLLKYCEFQDAALLVELAEHLKLARQHCVKQRSAVLRSKWEHL